ncbi:helix-turn-helix transcriptional regulator [Solimonas flava]|uniref:helix-turn-helix transcriptional regulator n=1 Tax=Solimonas flava TaxID=415849 RepID=UPI000409C84C|nr:helix-turn-helix transcriptional regulator [Solimonas flava]
MSDEVPRPPSAARAALGGYLQISARGCHRLRSVRFTAPALIGVQAGRKRLRRGPERIEFGAGAWFAVPAGVVLDIENLPPADGPYRALCLAFDPALLRASAVAARAAPPPWQALRTEPALLQAVEHLHAGLAQPQPLPERLLRHRFEEVWLALAEQGFVAGLQAAPTTAERVRALLAGAPSRLWRSAEVAARLALSEATLRRRLAEEDTGLRELLGDLRLGQALAALQSTQQPVARIAYDAGYRSASRFAAAFRRRYGVAPSTIRGDERGPHA